MGKPLERWTLSTKSMGTVTAAPVLHATPSADTADSVCFAKRLTIKFETEAGASVRIDVRTKNAAGMLVGASDCRFSAPDAPVGKNSDDQRNVHGKCSSLNLTCVAE